MSALQTLAEGMAENSYLLVSAPGEETTMANAQPRTLIEYDGKATDGTGTWTSDNAVAQDIMAGVGLNTTRAMWAFSGAGIAYDGYCFSFGGGHAASGQGGFYEFDAELAAANINGGGTGIAWNLKVPSGRWLDQFTEPEPAWSSQPPASPQPTGPNQEYYVTTNKQGRNMPAVGHSYHGLKAIPGTRTFLLSNFGVYSSNGQPAIGKPWAYDAETDTIIGPLTPTDNTGGLGPEIIYGYGQYQGAEGGPTPVCISQDGTVYSPASNSSPAFGNFVVKYTNPLTAAITQEAAGPFDARSFSYVRSDGVIIPDPADPLDEVMFIHGAAAGGGYDDTQFLLITGLKGHATPSFSVQSYASGAVTTAGGLFLSPCHDTKRDVIVFTDGANLFQVTPNASKTAWTIAQITGSTGNLPPSGESLAPGNGTTVVPALQYLADVDLYLHVQSAEVRVYKPLNWAPPRQTARVRSTYNFSGKKIIFEVTPDASTDITNVGVGLDDGTGLLTSKNDGIIWYGDGSVSYNGAAGAYTAAPFAVSDSLAVAFDDTAKLVWFRKGAGNWNNDAGADPAAGLGGFSYSAITLPVYLVASLFSAGDALTANFGATAFNNAAPSGFLSPNASLNPKVSALSTLQWNLRQTVALPGTVEWNVRVAVAQALTAKWNSRALVSSTETLKWALRQAIAEAITAQWNVRQLAVGTDTLQWKVRQLATSSDTFLWNLRQAIMASTTFDWNVIERIASSSTLEWNLIERISNTETLKWDLLVNGRVSASVSLPWNMIGRIAQSSTLPWNVRNQVLESSDLRWRLRNQLAALSDLRWSDRQRLIVPQTVEWDIKSLVSSPVDEGITLIWNNRNQVASPAAMQWRVRQHAENIVQVKWNDVGRIISLLHLLYRIGDVTNIDDLPAELINIPFVDFDLIY